MPTCSVSRCQQWVLKPISVLAMLALLVTLWGGLPTHAQRGDTIVRPDRVEVDWLGAARDAALSWPELSSPLASTKLTPLQRARVAKRLRSYTRKEGMLPLAHLNTLVAELYPGVATIPIPVLAPVNTEHLSAPDSSEPIPTPHQAIIAQCVDREIVATAWIVRIRCARDN